MAIASGRVEADTYAFDPHCFARNSDVWPAAAWTARRVRTMRAIEHCVVAGDGSQWASAAEARRQDRLRRASASGSRRARARGARARLWRRRRAVHASSPAAGVVCRGDAGLLRSVGKVRILRVAARAPAPPRRTRLRRARAAGKERFAAFSRLIALCRAARCVRERGGGREPRASRRACARAPPRARANLPRSARIGHVSRLRRVPGPSSSQRHAAAGRARPTVAAATDAPTRARGQRARALSLTPLSLSRARRAPRESVRANGRPRSFGGGLARWRGAPRQLRATRSGGARRTGGRRARAPCGRASARASARGSRARRRDRARGGAVAAARRGSGAPAVANNRRDTPVNRRISGSLSDRRACRRRPSATTSSALSLAPSSSALAVGRVVDDVAPRCSTR